MARILPRERRIEVLHHLVEGNTLRSTARLTGVHRTTIQDLLVDFGAGCKKLIDAKLRNLTLTQIECDEVWKFVGKKQARLTIDQKAESSELGDVYLWTALDSQTKLVASHLVGKRSADNARKLMMDLAGRLVFPQPHASDSHAFVPGQQLYITQISTDGFAGYSEAVDLAFGRYARYGQIVKDYRNATMVYTPSEMVGASRRGVFGIQGEDEERSICTSHVERHNLTIRTLLKRFTRLSLGFSKKLANLEAACSMLLAYYNFVWRTRLPEKSGRYRLPAAMAAGVVDTLWSFEDLYDNAIAA